jgi:EAL domain-containing protein (putative c-di-GMP-specific phosphodiesterase class I)
MAEIRAINMIPQTQAVPEENLLLDHLRGIEKSRGDTFAVHIHLADLRAHYRQPHYMRIAARAFDPLVNNHDATLYNLTNLDMVVFCRGVPVDELDAPIFKLRALFAEDPLTVGEEGSLDDRFTTWYDLAQTQDYYTFIDVLAGLAAQAADRAQRPSTSNDSRQTAMGGQPLEPGNLGAINARLQSAPLDDLIREQTAVQVDQGLKGKIVFREYFMSMLDVQRRVAPEINLFANTWLFQYLSETLDRRMLAVQAMRDFNKLGHSLSLNLNISTIVSPGFRTFHERVGNNTRKVVIELQVVDIFADMSAYIRARTWLQEHGYRVLVDGLTPLSLQFFDPGLLQADFIKLSWSQEFLGGLSEERMAEVRDVIEHAGKDRVVLARVDTEDAIKWALGLGVSRFQGHFIDRLVEAMQGRGIL